MKILFLMSGMTHYFNRIVSRINGLPGVEVVYVTPSSFEHIAEKEGVHQTHNGANFRWFELPMKRNKFGLNLKHVRKLLGVEKIDMIVFSAEYSISIFTDIKFLFVAYRKRIGLIMKSIPFQTPKYRTARNDIAKNTSLMQRIFKRIILELNHFSYSFSDAHICYIPEAREIYESYGVDPNRIVISFNSPDTDELIKIREEIEGGTDRPVRKLSRIIHIGRLVEWKRVDLLIRAIGRIKKNIPDVELIVIGYGPMETTLRELAIGLGIADAIKFVGGIYDPVELGRILLSAGVYVLAGMGGISINDAMCFGLPIVCSICDGTEKILVRDGQNGTYFNSGDEVDLAEKIKWIIGDPKRWKTMSEASTSIIRNEININTLLSAYQAVFNTVKTRTNKSVLNRLAPVWFKLALSSFMVQKYKKIHPKVRIKRTAKVECRHGGQIEIGSNTEILDYALILTYGGTIKIGEKCSINPFCVIYGHGGVVIGNHVLIAAHTVIIPSGHNFSDSSRTIFSQGNNSKGIVIEDDVWIGSGCKILDGVTIGRGAVIGAGAVVNKSIEAYSIAVGVPAHIVKKRGDGPFNRS